ALAYTTSFILFLMFPAEGPWVILKELHHVKPEGGLFIKLNQFTQSQGSIRGGCFPSSHVGAAFVMAWATLRYQRRLGWVILLFSIGVALATVYCQYHHAVDSIAGALWGTISFLVGSWILRKWYANKVAA
ncbi:hypothetical protein BVY01_03555, partial [bacterium I07]